MFSFHVETDKHTGFRGIFKHVAMQTMKIGDAIFGFNFSEKIFTQFSIAIKTLLLGRKHIETTMCHAKFIL